MSSLSVAERLSIFILLIINLQTLSGGYLYTCGHLFTKYLFYAYHMLGTVIELKRWKNVKYNVWSSGTYNLSGEIDINT